MWRWQVIAALVKEHGLAVGAEIGVAEGRFSAGLLTLCPELSLWAFDDYKPGYKTWMGTEWDEDTQSRNKARLMQTVRQFTPRLTFVEKSSLEAAAWLEDASLDFVFIDADHSYEAVKADIAAWWPKLKPGGFLTGHDYDSEKFPGVVRAVDEAFPEMEFRSDFVWIARKASGMRPASSIG
jgi:hypothetical protein